MSASCGIGDASKKKTNPKESTLEQ